MSTKWQMHLHFLVLPAFYLPYYIIMSTLILAHLTDNLIVIGHLVVDEGEGVVAGSPGVGADQVAPVCLSLLGEQVNCCL